MKKITLLATTLMFLHSFGQSGFNFKSPDQVQFDDKSTLVYYQQFLENQEKSFQKANSEVFILDGLTWTRPFGETSYCLTPTMNNVQEYESRIASENDKSENIYKSNFHFINIEVTETSKNLLKGRNIIVPDYVKNEVICYLPQIDIDYLISNNIKLNYLVNYGTNSKPLTKDYETMEGSKALIWSEDFESNTVPGSDYNLTNGTGAVDCGWEDVDCYSHGGSWSVWCASFGSACNACGNSYVNDMETSFNNSTYINVSNFSDIYFNYWIDLDMNNSGTNDELRRYDDLGFGSWSLQFTATSASNWDGQLWQQGSVSYVGQSFSQYGFLFSFISNWTGTSYGVYLDDLQITGTAVADISEIQNLNEVRVYPNPSKGKFILELDSKKEDVVELSVTNMSGQLMYQENEQIVTGTFQKSIDLNALAKGVYSLEIKTSEGAINKKLVIQ